MHLGLQVLIICVSTLGAGWLMIAAGLQKKALERRSRRRICPSCGREITQRICPSCAGL